MDAAADPIRQKAEATFSDQKCKAKNAVERAAAHLRDYALRLESDGYKAMSGEISKVADDLSLPVMVMGFPVTYVYSFDGNWKPKSA